MGLATIVMVLAMLKKPNRFILVLNFMGLKYLSLSKAVFGGLTCCSLSEQTSSSRSQAPLEIKRENQRLLSRRRRRGITMINLTLWGSTSPGGKAVYGVLRR